MRMWPALCAGLILAACTSDNSGQHSAEPPPAMSSGVAIPGETSEPMSTISDRVLFQTDSALLQPEAQHVLLQQATWLQQYPKHTLTIEGHADERGTREYNLALGERRAQAVLNYLIALGVDPKRLKTISYGKERPTCTEPNEACWSQNRRGVSTLDQ